MATSPDVVERPEPLTLKVMRLRRPPLLPPAATPPLGIGGCAAGAEAPKLLLPMALIQSLVGEAFTGYLHLSNTSTVPVFSASMKVELQIGHSRYVLFNNETCPKERIEPGDFFDAMVDCELKDPGTYVLTCQVTYTADSSSEPASFRRSYRFPALQPFATVHRVAQMDAQLLVECTVENTTQNNIYLTSWELACVDGFQASVVEADSAVRSGGGGSSSSSSGSSRGPSMHLLKPRGSHSLVFRVVPTDTSGDVVARVRHMDSVGTLMLGWHLPDGPSGTEACHQVRVRPVASPVPLDLRVAECPTRVRIEEPFRLEVEVFNRAAHAVEPNLLFDPRLMGSIRIHGVTLHNVGRIEPNCGARLPLDLLVTTPGLHGLQGLFLVDSISNMKSEFGVLCDILAF